MACRRGLISSLKIFKRTKPMLCFSERFSNVSLLKLPERLPNLRTHPTKFICIPNRYYCKENEDNQKINVDEEIMRYDYEEYEENLADSDDETVEIEEELPLHLCQRGKHGVYDVDQIVTLLKDEKMKDICAINIDPEFNYCDQMVIATGKSFRQLKAVAEKIKLYYKVKRNKQDPGSAIVEGLESKKWLAIDLDNIVIHLFLKEERVKYNLEELWAVGPEYDQQCIDLEAKAAYVDSSFEEALEQFRKSNTTDKTTQ